MSCVKIDWPDLALPPINLWNAPRINTSATPRTSPPNRAPRTSVTPSPAAILREMYAARANRS